MSEQKPIKKADLARHWRVSAPYITKLVKGKGMPVFTDLGTADNWRAVNAPPKAANQNVPETSLKKPVEAGKKRGDSPETTTPPETKSAGGPSTPSAGDGVVIDVTRFIRRDMDFDALMIQQAEEKPMIASGLYDLACQRGNPAEISSALKNWHESAKASGDVRSRFIEIQETTRALLPLDEVMDVVGTDLQQVRASMLKLGERHASAANPQDPALAQRVIDAAVDEIFRQLEHILARASTELAPKTPAAAAALAS